MRRSGVLVFALVGLLVAVGAAETQEVAAEPWKFEGLPWSIDEIRAAYTVGTKLTYERSGTRKDGAEATGTHTFEVVRIDGGSYSYPDGLVHIDSIWKDGGERSTSNITSAWADAVLLASHPSSSSTEFEIVGSEQVETPAGTFDTVVVEVTNSMFETSATYWLVADQPGVYAKWVDFGKPDDEQELVMTLQEVAGP